MARNTSNITSWFVDSQRRILKAIVHPYSLAGAAIVFVLLPSLATAGPPISFEFATEPGFPLGGAQSWVELFARLEQTSIRIRQAEPGDRELVENQGTDERPVYRVVGILTSRNRLRLPGGEFSLDDRTRIGDWIKKVLAEGASAPTRRTTVFGLTEEQLVAFHDKLATPITCTTSGRRAGDVARDIVKGLSCEFTVSDTARQAFSESETMDDDLKGLSSGTALAATIRPLGLVIRPDNAGRGAVRLRICSVRETEEAWPIGWPPQQIPVKIAPKLSEYLKVNIENQPLTTAMNVVGQRVQVPFLWDHNSMARKRIDPAAVKVSFKKDREAYQTIMDNLLYQGGLKSELRVDEAGHPFIWISTR